MSHEIFRKYVIRTRLSSKKDDDVVQQQAIASGSFVEFCEKKRTHIGKIVSLFDFACLSCNHLL